MATKEQLVQRVEELEGELEEVYDRIGEILGFDEDDSEEKE